MRWRSEDTSDHKQENVLRQFIRSIVTRAGGPYPVQLEALLDPKFWQALGKARGWGSAGVQPSALHDSDHRIKFGQEWQYRSFRFVAHLADGKDAESFFASLI